MEDRIREADVINFLPCRHPSDYLVAIKPDGELIRCFDEV